MELSKEKWEKLVCVMFTGAKISHVKEDNKIRSILETHGIGFNALKIPAYRYFPKVTALYQENHKGAIVRVITSGGGEHAEEKLVRDTVPSKDLRSVHSGIGISYSPCTLKDNECADKIVKRYEKEATKPVIHFSWVYNHPDKEPHGREGIEHLIENGFNLKVWETTRMLHYLLEHAPTGLKRELQQAYDHTIVALSERDIKTQELIEEAREKVHRSETKSVKELVGSMQSLQLEKALKKEE